MATTFVFTLPGSLPRQVVTKMFTQMSGWKTTKICPISSPCEHILYLVHYLQQIFVSDHNGCNNCALLCCLDIEQEKERNFALLKPNLVLCSHVNDLYKLGTFHWFCFLQELPVVLVIVFVRGLLEQLSQQFYGQLEIETCVLWHSFSLAERLISIAFNVKYLSSRLLLEQTLVFKLNFYQSNCVFLFEFYNHLGSNYYFAIITNKIMTSYSSWYQGRLLGSVQVVHQMRRRGWGGVARDDDTTDDTTPVVATIHIIITEVDHQNTELCHHQQPEN